MRSPAPPRAVSRPPASPVAKEEPSSLDDPPQSAEDLAYWRAQAQGPAHDPFANIARRIVTSWERQGLIAPEPGEKPAGGESLATDPPAG